MSRNGLEKVLHQLCVDRAAKARLREDPEGYLARLPLPDDEKAMLRHFDVAALQRLGVNPMLTLGYWSENAPDRSMPAYMKALRGKADEVVPFGALLKR